MSNDNVFSSGVDVGDLRIKVLSISNLCSTPLSDAGYVPVLTSLYHLATQCPHPQIVGNYTYFLSFFLHVTWLFNYKLSGTRSASYYPYAYHQAQQGPSVVGCG